MKGLVLKDMLNVRHTLKSYVIALAILAVTFIPTSGFQGYLYVVPYIGTMLISTTFSYDELSHWSSFAMVLPVTRRQLAGAKYIDLLFFSIGGAIIGVTVGITGGVLTHQLVWTSPQMQEVLVTALISLLLAIAIGSVLIPLTFKYGTQKGRLLLIVVAVGIPALCIYGGMKLLRMLHLLTARPAWLDNLPYPSVILAAVAIVLICLVISYLISCKIVENQDL